MNELEKKVTIGITSITIVGVVIFSSFMDLSIVDSFYFVVTMLTTVEFRYLCKSNNVKYKCIEYEKENFLELQQFLIHKDSTKNLIESDWRDMKFKETFDVFIGDLATTVTPVKDHDEIFKNIKNHLNPNGRLILKVPLRENNNILTHEQIFSKYRKNLSHLNPFSAVWNEVVLADYDFKEDTMNSNTSLNKLTESYKKHIITKYEFTEYKKRWGVMGDFKMNIPLKGKFLKKLKKHFTIEKITSGNDLYKKDVPIIILKK
ncbi:MAG: class I SAM-dependent methyltransferase [Candidatus Woesearchaeota archaeon]|jgi:SAM-dependent methyltransferase|nr:class I SAM-dependent methyltransferase [Candidatus Woesearchaeota archaeon]